MASENAVVVEPGKSTSSYQVTPKGKKKQVPLELTETEDSNRMEKENGKEKEKGPREFKEKQKSIKKIGHRRVDETGQVSYKKTPSSALMAAIQLGLGHSVGRLSAKPERDVLMADFTVVEHYYFPSEGSQETPGHRYADFKFKTYAPVAFRYFRELFNMKPDDYMMALCHEPLQELSNAGASGSLFYVTNDDEFIIKTVQHKEAEFLQKLLPGYYLNLNQNKRTLLPKFFGLYCYQCGGKNIRLVVMNNLLPTEYKIHLKYDLKGSTYKRKASKHERAKASPTLKDLDFINDHPEGIYLEPDTYNAVMKTIQRDCRVLESFKIMDYSMLVGIHNLDEAAKENATVSTPGEKPETPLDKTPPSPVDPPTPLTPQGTSQVPPIGEGGKPKLMHKRSVRGREGFSSAWEAIKLRDELERPVGGIPARNAKGERLLIFLGIIDILQSYRFLKKFEHGWKALVHDGDTVSVHRPSFYSQRFQDFMAKNVFQIQPGMENLAKTSPRKRSISALNRVRSMTEADRARAEALRRQKSISSEAGDAAEFSRSRSFNDADRTQGATVSHSKEQSPNDAAVQSAGTVGSQPSHKSTVDKKVVVIDPKEETPTRKGGDADSGVASLETQESFVTVSNLRSEQILSNEHIQLVETTDKLAPKAHFDDSINDVSADRANGIVGTDHARSSSSSTGNKSTGDSRL